MPHVWHSVAPTPASTEIVATPAYVAPVAIQAPVVVGTAGTHA